ncbi:unnamed protein product [Dovyalis caffra]|uniref:Uncharacterized protein n=1 Tax=Dovyalis caffra TaxID=77055 RepID=A0AAV1R1N6_9ROSI|nr:unnamed protein product [Dovyalis caffra]
MSVSSSYRRSNRGRSGLPLDTLPTVDITPSSVGPYTSFCDYSISNNTLFNQNRNASSIYHSPGFDLPIDVLSHSFETTHRNTTRLDAIAFDFGCTSSPGASPSCISDEFPVECHLCFDSPHQSLRNVDS